MPYITDVMVIDSKNISNFLDVPNRRLIRPSQVRSILDDLMKGDFHSPSLVLEKIDRHKMYVLDGGHRMDGFGQYLDMYPSTKISIPCHIYEKLTDEQRRHIYNRYNIPIRQTRDDMIHTYKDTIPIYDGLIQALPCTIYGKERENMKLSHVCSCYISAQHDGEFTGGFEAKPHAFVTRLQELDMTDLNNIIMFWSVMKRSFNIVDGESITHTQSLKTTPFSVLFRLWYQNKDRIADDDIVDRFKDLRNKQFQGKPLLEEWATRTGHAQAKQGLLDIRSKINRLQPKELRFKDNF